MNQMLTYMKHIHISALISSLTFLLLFSSSRYSSHILSLQQINTYHCLSSSFFLHLSPFYSHKQLPAHVSRTKTNCLFKQALLFCSLLWVGSGAGWQQIVCVQWIAAQESINWGLCKWTEQWRNQLQSPAKSCLLTHLLKHAGKLTALDFNGMNLKWWRLETVKKRGLASLGEADGNSKRDVEKRYKGPRLCRP